MDSDFANANSPDYCVIYVRGHKVVITPAVINGYFHIDGMADPFENPSLSLITYFLRNGVLDAWDSNNVLKANKLTTFYAILHSLLANN